MYYKRGHEGDNVRSASTPLGVNNKVPLKVSRMCWNFHNQMLFLGLEYCKKKFSKKSFRNLKKGYWILVIVQLLGLMWQLVRSCAEPRWFVFVLQTASDCAIHGVRQKRQTYLLLSFIKVQPLGHAYKLIWLSRELFFKKSTKNFRRAFRHLLGLSGLKFAKKVQR